MALFTESQLRAAAQAGLAKSYRATASAVLLEKAEAATGRTGFDMFLSHSVRDAELVLGMVQILEGMGYRVYVDWLVDTQLDRSQVTPGTARVLRDRMKTCQSLLFLNSGNTVNSKWMPWECGYFDGIREKVAIIPVVKESAGNSYYGQEYLGLYPYTTFGTDTSNIERIWIRPDAAHYLWYNDWVATPNATLRWKDS